VADRGLPYVLKLCQLTQRDLRTARNTLGLVIGDKYADRELMGSLLTLLTGFAISGVWGVCSACREMGGGSWSGMRSDQAHIDGCLGSPNFVTLRSAALDPQVVIREPIAQTLNEEDSSRRSLR
jgi:hypothetical protein